RGRVELRGTAAATLEGAPATRKIRATPGRGALAAEGNRLAAQADVPGAVRQLARRREQPPGVRGAALERGIAEEDRVFRTAGGVALAPHVPAATAQLRQAHLHRDGPGRRDRDAAVVPDVHRREPGGRAVLGAVGAVGRGGGTRGVIFPPLP